MPPVLNPFDDSYLEPSKVTSIPFFDDAVNPAYDDLQEAHSLNAAAEASWQYLGDLPYRKIPIYSSVRWNRTGLVKSGSARQVSVGSKLKSDNDDEDFYSHGLAQFRLSAIKKNEMLDRRELRTLLNTTTVTKVVGCPHGGPLAAVTLPLLKEAAGGFAKTEIRILTNAGEPLATIHFPPTSLDAAKYSLDSIITIGFTHRSTLVIVLKDSMCITYDLRGDPLLPPFFILSTAEGGTEITHASVYEGGVAVLARNKSSALVELLDDHDDPTYLQTAHIAARQVASNKTSVNPLGGQEILPPHYALITHLPTADYAKQKSIFYMCIQVLPRTRTVSRHPEVFLSTSDKSVIVVNSSTLEIVDVDCRARLSAPIVDMVFAPNGRFLACFTVSSMLTVISTSFETKVLDFDTSEGSSSPPLEMRWCGEDR
jgi:vacuolar protein sorting-associated protein 16